MAKNSSTLNTSLEAFAPLKASSNALLTTFRRSGQGVSTPVGIHIVNGKAYFTTWSTTGKVKRLARNPQVTLAPCTRMGKVLGPTVAGIARRLEEAEARAVYSTFKTTLRVQQWLWLLIYKLRGWQPVFYEVSPLIKEMSIEEETHQQQKERDFA